MSIFTRKLSKGLLANVGSDGAKFLECKEMNSVNVQKNSTSTKINVKIKDKYENMDFSFSKKIKNITKFLLACGTNYDIFLSILRLVQILPKKNS